METATNQFNPGRGTKDCTRFGASPMQPKPASFLFLGPEFVVPVTPLSEDCLYINVWSAAHSAREKRPVMVWIYGGGFVTGGAAAPGYSGEALAEKELFLFHSIIVSAYSDFFHIPRSRQNHRIIVPAIMH